MLNRNCVCIILRQIQYNNLNQIIKYNKCKCKCENIITSNQPVKYIFVKPSILKYVKDLQK